MIALAKIQFVGEFCLCMGVGDVWHHCVCMSVTRGVSYMNLRYDCSLGVGGFLVCQLVINFIVCYASVGSDFLYYDFISIPINLIDYGCDK